MLLVPLVPAVAIPACDDRGAPAVVGVVLLGSVGGVVVDGDVVLGGSADPGVAVVGGIGAVGVGDVVVGDAVVAGVDEPATPAVDDDAAVPGAPGEPALPIVGLARTNDGVAAAPVELAGDVTHPVTVTI